VQSFLISLTSGTVRLHGRAICADDDRSGAEQLFAEGCARDAVATIVAEAKRIGVDGYVVMANMMTDGYVERVERIAARRSEKVIDEPGLAIWREEIGGADDAWLMEAHRVLGGWPRPN
jgi:hypothetical protein